MHCEFYVSGARFYLSNSGAFLVSAPELGLHPSFGRFAPELGFAPEFCTRVEVCTRVSAPELGFAPEFLPSSCWCVPEFSALFQDHVFYPSLCTTTISAILDIICIVHFVGTNNLLLGSYHKIV